MADKSLYVMNNHQDVEISSLLIRINATVVFSLLMDRIFKCGSYSG